MAIEDYSPIFFNQLFYFSSYSTLNPVVDFKATTRYYDQETKKWRYKTVFDTELPDYDEFIRERRSLFKTAFAILANKQVLPKKFCCNLSFSNDNGAIYTNGHTIDLTFYGNEDVDVQRQRVPLVGSKNLSAITLKDLSSVQIKNGPNSVGDSGALIDFLFEIPDALKNKMGGLVNHTHTSAVSSGASIFSDRYEQLASLDIGRYKDDGSLSESYVAAFRLGEVIQDGYDANGDFVYHIKNESGFWSTLTDLTEHTIYFNTTSNYNPGFVFKGTNLPKKIQANDSDIIVTMESGISFTPGFISGRIGWILVSIEAISGSSIVVTPVQDGSHDVYNLDVSGSVDNATFNDVENDYISGVAAAGSGANWLPVGVGGTSVFYHIVGDALYPNDVRVLINHLSSSSPGPTSFGATQIRNLFDVLYDVDWTSIDDLAPNKARPFDLRSKLNVWDAWLLKASIGGPGGPSKENFLFVVVSGKIYIMDRLKIFRDGQITAAQAICEWVPRDASAQPVTGIIGVDSESGSAINVVTDSMVYRYHRDTWCLFDSHATPDFDFYFDGRFWREKAASDIGDGDPTVESSPVTDPDTFSEVGAQNLRFWQHYETNCFEPLDDERYDVRFVTIKSDPAKFSNGWHVHRTQKLATTASGDLYLYPELICGGGHDPGDWVELGGAIETEPNTTLNTEEFPDTGCSSGTSVLYSGGMVSGPLNTLTITAETECTTGPNESESVHPFCYDYYKVGDQDPKERTSARYVYDVDDHEIYEPVDTVIISYSGTCRVFSDIDAFTEPAFGECSIETDDGHFSLSASGFGANIVKLKTTLTIQPIDFLNDADGYELIMSGEASVTVNPYTSEQPSCATRQAHASASLGAQSIQFYRLQDIEYPEVYNHDIPAEPPAIDTNNVDYTHTLALDSLRANAQNNRADRLFGPVRDYMIRELNREFRIDRASAETYPYMSIHKNFFNRYEFISPLLTDSSYEDRAAELFMIGESVKITYLYGEISEIKQYDDNIGSASLSSGIITYTASTPGSDCVYVRIGSGVISLPIFVMPSTLLSEEDMDAGYAHRRLGKGSPGFGDAVFVATGNSGSSDATSVTVRANADVDWTFNKAKVEITNNYETTGKITVTCALGHNWFAYLSVGRQDPYFNDVKKYVVAKRIDDNTREFDLSRFTYGLPKGAGQDVRLYVEDVVCSCCAVSDEIELTEGSD